MSVLLRVENLTKRFSGVVANDRLNFDVARGEIHALLGENGAGKSTLMNMLYGMQTPDSGSIFWKGGKVCIRSPRQAIRLGIGMVHQHFMHIGSLTVLENVVLGLRTGLVSNRSADEARLLQLAAEFQQPIDPQARVNSLSIGEQQRLEILKAVYRNAELLILDEPTAALTPAEADKLFVLCRRLVAQGKSVIFITHRLDEVKALSDRITVLRLGRVVGTFQTADRDRTELARLMVDRDLEKTEIRLDRKVGLPVLKVSGLDAPSTRFASTLRNLSLCVSQGEIVGIAGVDGNGQTELVEALLGLRHVSGGSIHLNDRDLTGLSTADRLVRGLACIPADRHACAVIEDFSLVGNALLGHSSRAPVARHGWMDPALGIRFTQEIVDQYQIKATALDVPLHTLSGGHQQRFVFGRTLALHPEILIAAQPTRGLDISSVEFVRRKLMELRDSGKGILLISMDLDELLILSDRIEVMREGRIVGSVAPPFDRNAISLLMTGSSPTPRVA